jgi:polar amino acid transport system substrate-binding protein
LREGETIMGNTKAFLVAAFAVALLGILFVSLAAANDNNSSSYILNPEAKEELVAFAIEAKDFVLAEGKDKALQVFNDPNGKFVRGELYIIAYDFNGTRLANINKKSGTTGENVLNATDPNGVSIVRNMLDLAKKGGGFTYYIWPNPAHSNAEELKLTYVLKVDEGLWLGAGMYLPGVAPIFSNESRKDLVAFVEKARDFALNHTKNESLRAFNDRNGEFVTEDRYIFADDFEGTRLAMPFYPDQVGTNMSQFQDPNDVYVIQEFSDTAKRGDGFVYCIVPDPNGIYKLRLVYVMKLNDEWFLGSGLFWPEAGS